MVQQVLKRVIEPVFEPQFHDGSYGYRPKRSAQKAVAHAIELMRERGLEQVVDMDLSKCFDLLDHDLILNAVKRSITDGSILALIRMFLESGVMKYGELSPTEIGSPQGGVSGSKWPHGKMPPASKLIWPCRTHGSKSKVSIIPRN